jgi:hypothetical protein
VDTAHVAGWLLVGGAVGFGIGAGNPYLARAWTAPQDVFLRIVAGHPQAWRFTTAFFVAGTVATAAGLLLVPALIPGDWPRGLAAAGSVTFLLAAALWLVSLVYRLAVTAPVARRFVDGGTVDPWIADLDRLNGVLFKAFIVLAFSGLAATGLAIVGGGPIPAPVGWGTTALSGLLILGLIISGDMPPFTVYLPTLVIGIALLTGG